MKSSTLIFRPMMITAVILLIPFLGNIFVDGWNWNWTAFVFLGLILFSAGIAYELAGKYTRTGIIIGFVIGEIIAGCVIATLSYLNPNEDLAGIVIFTFLLSGLFFAFAGFLIQKYGWNKKKS